MSAAKRTRLRAVYLTGPERDLLISGMRTLCEELKPNEGYAVTKFAKSFTARRISEVIAILQAVDAAPETGAEK